MSNAFIEPMPRRSTTHSDVPRLDFGMKPLLIVLLVGVLAVVFLTALAAGSVDIPLEQIMRVLVGGEAEKTSWTNIILKFRLPKAITAVLAGTALSVSGLMMQTFFRNPLAGPFVLGISSGASLGVALVVMAYGVVGGTLLAGVSLSGDLLLAAAAGIGAAISMVLVLLVAHRVENTMTLLIVGLMFGYMTGAIVSLLFYFSIPERIQAYINWTFGSFSSVTWDQMQIFAPTVIVGLAVAGAMIKPLNALLLGEAYARTMGLNIKLARWGIVTSTAVLAGVVTAFCGPIGFVGIAVPHLCRSLFNTSDHRVLLPACVLMGAIVALTAAIIAELPGSTIVLPLNAVTSFLGAPVVIMVILRRRNLRKSFAA